MLAGVSLALMSRRTPAPWRWRSAPCWSALLGLALGELETGLAVILTYYGLLFLLGLPFLAAARPGAVRLGGGLGRCWPRWSPQLLRPHLPAAARRRARRFDQLADPGHLLSELLFTGYYPVVTWLAYLLLGLALGRCDLRSPPVQAGLVAGGLAAAVLAFVVSRSFTEQPWVLRRLVPDAGRYGDVSTADAFVDAISARHARQHPGRRLVGLAARRRPAQRHAVRPGGDRRRAAALVIGACLLLVSALGPAALRGVAIAFGAGTMTLSLYSLHVVLRTGAVWPAEEPSSFGWHLLVLLGLGAVFVGAGRRGPLEWLVGRVSAGATRWPGRYPSPSGGPRPRSGRTRPGR